MSTELKTPFTPVQEMLDFWSSTSGKYTGILVKIVDYTTMGDYAVIVYDTIVDDDEEMAEWSRNRLREVLKASDSILNHFKTGIKATDYKTFEKYDRILDSRIDDDKIVLHISL